MRKHCNDCGAQRHDMDDEGCPVCQLIRKLQEENDELRVKLRAKKAKAKKKLSIPIRKKV